MIMASAGGDGSAKPEAAEDVVDWKKLQTLSSEPQYPRKRRGKIRQIPDTYFLPRRSLPSALAFYGAFIVAGIGAGMLVEKWIQMKVAEDGGTLWDMSSNKSSDK